MNSFIGFGQHCINSVSAIFSFFKAATQTTWKLVELVMLGKFGTVTADRSTLIAAFSHGEGM